MRGVAIAVLVGLIASLVAVAVLSSMQAPSGGGGEAAASEGYVLTVTLAPTTAASTGLELQQAPAHVDLSISASCSKARLSPEQLRSRCSYRWGGEAPPGLEGCRLTLAVTITVVNASGHVVFQKTFTLTHAEAAPAIVEIYLTAGEAAPGTSLTVTVTATLSLECEHLSLSRSVSRSFTVAVPP